MRSLRALPKTELHVHVQGACAVFGDFLLQHSLVCAQESLIDAITVWLAEIPDPLQEPSR